MDSAKKQRVRRWPAILAFLVVGWLLNTPNSATFAVAPAELSFGGVVVPGGPVGIAASLGRLLVTQFCSNQVLSISGKESSANTSVFATLPRPSTVFPCANGEDDYIAIVPAQLKPQTVAGFPTPFFNGFTSNDVYVTRGPNIIKIPWNATIPFDARSVLAFKILPCPASGNGITFDQVGTFGNFMIVVCADGSGVWLLNGSGQTVNAKGAPTSKPIATIPIAANQTVQGPDVAPLTFGSLGGQLLVTVSPVVPGNPLPGGVVAVNPKNGKVSEVSAVPTTAQSVAAIPTMKCAFAQSSAAYFTAAFQATTVDFQPVGMGVFSPFAGSALVTNESQVLPSGAGIIAVTPTGATSTFESFTTALQGQAFVNCATPVLLVSSRTTSTISIGPGSAPPNGVIHVDIAQTDNFDPRKICVGGNPGTTADGTALCSLAPPTYGLTGTEQSFKSCGTTLVSSGSGPAVLDCQFFKALLSAQTVDKFNGTLILKLNYFSTTENDGAEGSN